MSDRQTNNLVLIAAVFSMAMGFLESAVVVYLRTIYYPSGFSFPLTPLDLTIAVTEVLREAATMIMLVSFSMIAARGLLMRFSVFIFSFAVWDITYYIFLWLILGWPPSLMTWDILFLIPVTWTGPVLAPVINSASMIVLALLIVRYKRREILFRPAGAEWAALLAGSLITMIAYMKPFLQHFLSRYSLADLFRQGSNGDIASYSMHFVPEEFSWMLFSCGEILFFLAILNMVRRMRRK
jgi:hypothetical protein